MFVKQISTAIIPRAAKPILTETKQNWGIPKAFMWWKFYLIVENKLEAFFESCWPNAMIPRIIILLSKSDVCVTIACLISFQF